jgi:hypothetical protein
MDTAKSMMNPKRRKNRMRTTRQAKIPKNLKILVMMEISLKHLTPQMMRVKKKRERQTVKHLVKRLSKTMRREARRLKSRVTMAKSRVRVMLARR